MPDDLSALSVKVDLMMAKIDEQGRQLTLLKSDFDQSRGALRLIKISAAISVAVATVWAVIHGMKP